MLYVRQLDIYTYVYNIYLWVTDEEVASFTQGLLQRYYKVNQKLT